jgi:hypothetical protein
MVRLLVVLVLVAGVFGSKAHAGADASPPGKNATERPKAEPKTPRLTDAEIAEIKARLVEESKASYRAKLQQRGKAGTCPCPDDTARDGSRCGGRSAYVRPGGEKPLCGPEDVTNGMVLDYRKAHRELDRAASAAGTNAAGQQERPAPFGLVAGTYKLTAHVTYRPTRTSDSSGLTADAEGSLTLRQFEGQREPLDRKYPLYGWTDVDFRALGATLGETPSSSQDPENVGVVIVTLPPIPGIERPSNAPILLIGTADNNVATRRSTDGPGIGLMVKTKEGECLVGTWGMWGILPNAAGRFTICPARTEPH